MHLINIIPIISILGLSGLFSIISKTEFKNSVPLIVSAIIIILYSLAAMNIILYGVIFLYVLGVISWYYIIKNFEEYTDFLKIKKSVVVCCFLIIIFFAIFYKNSFLTSPEDFIFGGFASKELFLRNGFGELGQINSIMGHDTYHARGASVFHYFFIALSEFSEGDLLFAHFLLYFSFLFPLIDRDSLSKTSLTLLLCFGVLSLMSSALRSLNTDGLIAVVFASCLAIYLGSNYKERSLITLVPIFMVIPLFKEIGLITSILLAMIIGFFHLRIENRVLSKKLTFTHFKIGLMIVSPIIVFFFQEKYFGTSQNELFPAKPFLDNYLVDLTNVSQNDGFAFTKFFQFLAKFAIKGEQIAIYCLVFAAYHYSKFDSQVHRNFVVLLKCLSSALIIFIVYVLYVSIFIDKTFSESTISRYFLSFEIVFPIISIYFLDKSLFFKEKTTNDKIIIITFIISALTFTASSLDRVPTFLSLEENFYHQQLKEVRELIKSGEEVEIRFDNKRSDLECYNLAFYLFPHITNNQVKLCLNKDVNYHNVYIGTIKNIPEIKKANCKIVYFPFLRDYDVECK